MRSLFLFLAIFGYVNAYKIGIMVPDISGSQFLFNQRMGEILAEAGHNVTLIRLQLIDYGKNLKTPNKPGLSEWKVNGFLPDVDYERIKEMHAKTAFEDDNIWSMVKKEKRESISMMMNTFIGACDKIVSDKEFVSKLQEAEFDVIFTHMYEFCSIGMQKVAKAKTWVWVNSGALMDYVAYFMGLPIPPSYAAPMMTDAGDSLTFAQRFKSIIGHTITPIFVKKLTGDPQTEIFRKYFGADFPHLIDIAKDAPLVFVNSNELYDLPRPTLHKIVNIGGLGMKQTNAKPLPKEYSDIIDKAESVVVFSFGSVANATLMPSAWKEAFMGAFKKFPKTHFFLRYEGKDIQPPENVHFSNWLPQVDLLQHPKTRGFITHGGFNSLQESILASQPLISIPLFGDQFRNARIAEKHGFGIVMPKSEISEETITNGLKEILTNSKYSQAVKVMNRMVLNKPIPPETLLIKWTEFVAEFKTLENLKPMGANLDAITYYNLDVYATVIAVVALVLFVTWKILAFILCRVGRLFGFGCSGKNEKKAKKE